MAFSKKTQGKHDCYNKFSKRKHDISDQYQITKRFVTIIIVDIVFDGINITLIHHTKVFLVIYKLKCKSMGGTIYAWRAKPLRY